MPGVHLRENEDIGSGLRKFKRAVEKSGVIAKARRCQAFEPPSKMRQRSMAAAVKRHLKKLSRENMQMMGNATRSKRG
jgi:small subunit ribosomal protein S21